MQGGCSEQWSIDSRNHNVLATPNAPSDTLVKPSPSFRDRYYLEGSAVERGRCRTPWLKPLRFLVKRRQS